MHNPSLQRARRYFRRQALRLKASNRQNEESAGFLFGKRRFPNGRSKPLPYVPPVLLIETWRKFPEGNLCCDRRRRSLCRPVCVVAIVLSHAAAYRCDSTFALLPQCKSFGKTPFGQFFLRQVRIASLNNTKEKSTTL